MPSKPHAEELRDSVHRFLQYVERYQASRGRPSLETGDRVDGAAHRAQMSAILFHKKVEGWADFEFDNPDVAQASIDLAERFLDIYNEQPKWWGKNGRYQKRVWSRPHSPWIAKLESKLDRLNLTLIGKAEPTPQETQPLAPVASPEPSMPKVRRESSIEARDKVIYEECCKLTKYTVIISLIKTRKTWKKIA